MSQSSWSSITTADFKTDGWFNAPNIADIHPALREPDSANSAHSPTVDPFHHRQRSGTTTSSDSYHEAESFLDIIAFSDLKVDGGGDKIFITANSETKDFATAPLEANDGTMEIYLKPSRLHVTKTKGGGDKVPPFPRYSLFPKPPPMSGLPPIPRTPSRKYQAPRHLTSPDTESISSQGSEIVHITYQPSRSVELPRHTPILAPSKSVRNFHPPHVPTSPPAHSILSPRHPASPPIRPTSPMTPIMSEPTSTVFPPDTDYGQPATPFNRTNSIHDSETLGNLPSLSQWSTESNDHNAFRCNNSQTSSPPHRRTLADLTTTGIRQMLKSSTPLIDAAKAGDTSEVLRLLAPGGYRTHTSSAVDKDGLTALHWAAKLGHLEVARALLERAAHTEARTKGHDRTPLFLASQNNHPSLVAFLLGSGAAVNATSKMDGATALHKAAHSGHLKIVKLLLAGGADVNRRDVEGLPPLWWATQGKQLLTAQLLIARGADLEARIKLGANLELGTRVGLTVLHKAVSAGNHDFARLFLEGGADANADAPMGLRALHRAAAKGDLRMCALLVELGGADLEKRTGEEWTPLLCAARWGHRRVCKWLVEIGADAFVKTKQGVGVMELARSGGYDDVL